MMVRFSKVALAFLTASAASEVRAEDGEIDISLFGAALISADRSPEAVGRCGPDEHAFVATFQPDTLDVSRYDVPREVATSPQGAPAVITIRRGDEVERAPSQALNSRFRTVHEREDVEAASVVDLTFDIRVLGCFYLGGLYVTDFEAMLDGRATFYRLTHRTTMQSEIGDEELDFSLGLMGREFSVGSSTAPRAGENVQAMRDFGTLRFHVTDQGHFLPAIEGGGGVPVGLSLTAFIDLETDGGLTP